MSGMSGPDELCCTEVSEWRSYDGLVAFSLPFVRDECASYIGLNESYPTEIPVFRERFDSCDRPYRSKGLGALFGVCLVATDSTVSFVPD